MRTKIMFGVAFVVVAAGAFFGGMKYGQTPKALAKLSGAQLMQVFAASRGNGNGGGFAAGAGRRMGGGANGGGFTGGQIIAKDDKSITIKLPNNGGSKTVYISDSSQVMKSVSGIVTDLANGQNVTVIGTSNSDGSITAQTIQIRPDMPAPAGQNQ